MTGSQSLSIVVPVFRNSESIEILVNEILSVKHLRFPSVASEIVFVDDGSDDESWQVILRMRDAYPEIVSAYKLTRNFGQLGAMVRGYELAKGDAVISISADLQDPTSLIGDMVETWLAGVDLVVATRTQRSDGFMKSITSRLAYGYVQKVMTGVPKGGFDFFLMSRRVVDHLLSFKGRFRFLQGDLVWLGYPTVWLPYERVKRLHGKSGYSWSRRMGNFIDLVLDSSYGPLKLMARLGALIAGLGVVYSGMIFGAWLVGDTPFSGWAPIMVSILIMGGMTMVMLGILGAYLWRIYDEVRQRPMSILLESRPRLQRANEHNRTD